MRTYDFEYEYEVGDKVIVIKSEYIDKKYLGKIGTITKIEWAGGIAPKIYVKFWFRTKYTYCMDLAPLHYDPYKDPLQQLKLK